MWSQYAVVYASVTLIDVGAGLLELLAGHCAFKRGITPPVKTYQGNINFHENVTAKADFEITYYWPCHLKVNMNRNVPNSIIN